MGSSRVTVSVVKVGNSDHATLSGPTFSATLTVQIFNANTYYSESSAPLSVKSAQMSS